MHVIGVHGESEKLVITLVMVRFFWFARCTKSLRGLSWSNWGS